MNGFMKIIKVWLKNFFDSCSTADPINDLSDYYRVKSWILKVKILYSFFSVVAVIAILFVLSKPELFADLPFYMYLVAPALMLLTGWGYATLIMYLPKIIKDVVSWGSTGYNVGEKFETTHVRVTHEYGNTYRATAHTENKGCLFAVIAGVARFMIWAFFCIYIGPFLTFKKLRSSIENINNYKQ